MSHVRCAYERHSHKLTRSGLLPFLQTGYKNLQIFMDGFSFDTSDHMSMYRQSCVYISWCSVYVHK